MYAREDIGEVNPSYEKIFHTFPNQETYTYKKPLSRATWATDEGERLKHLPTILEPWG